MAIVQRPDFNRNTNILLGCMLLLLVSYLVIITVYNNEGMGWDFVDSYLNAKTLTNAQFYTVQIPLNLTIVTQQNNVSAPPLNNEINYIFVAKNGIYLALVRPPIAALLISSFLLILPGIAVQAYLFLLLLLMLFGILFVSSKLKTNPLILAALLFSFFVLRWTVLYNSEELLSISGLLFFVGLLADKSELTGISGAILGLMKYTNLALLPMILLLGNFRKIGVALGFFIIFTLPFLIFFYIYFGNPLLSYEISFSEASANIPGGVSLVSLLAQTLLYPAVVILISIAIGFYFNGRAFLNRINPRLDFRYAIVFLFLIVALVEYAIEIQQVGVPMRFGYMPYTAISLLVVLLFSSVANEEIKWHGQHKIEKIGQFGLLFISLIILTGLFAQVSSNNYMLWLGLSRTQNPEITQVVHALGTYNISGCAVVSNVWPFLNLLNVTTYSSDALCNMTTQKLPIVVFNDFGPKEYCGYSIKFSNSTINAPNYSIALPKNYLCLKNNQ